MKELNVQQELLKRLKEGGPAVWERIKAYFPSNEIADLDGIAVDLGMSGFSLAEDEYFMVLKDFTYVNKSDVLTPMLVSSRICQNNGTTIAMERFTFSKGTEETYSFSFGVGFKVGTKLSIKVGIPGVGEGGQEISGEFSVSSSMEWVKRVSKQWSNQTDVPIPPHTTVKISGYIRQAKINADFSGKAVATGGRFLVFFNIKGEGNHVREFPVPLTVLLNESERTFAIDGHFEGAEGVEVYTKVDDV